MKVPCEVLVWEVLPWIRRELANSMIDDFKLTQAKVAKLLGLTEAAISQYRSSKRGNIKINDEKLLAEIKESARKIIEGGEQASTIEMCRICTLIKSSKLLPELYMKRTGRAWTSYACISEVKGNP